MELVEVLVRWVHFVAGITWIGILYFFNLVNVNFMKSLDPGTKGKVVPLLMPPSLWYFRWGAKLTVIAGIILILMSGGGSPSWNMFIGIGGTLGIIMYLNVWLIIWPKQKEIIRLTAEAAAKNEAPPSHVAGMAKTALLASRTNFWLSFPMLFCMAAASHFNW